MIPYKDGLSILENHDDADGNLTMTISKGVRLIVLGINQGGSVNGRALFSVEYWRTYYAALKITEDGWQNQVALSRLTDDKLIQ